MTSIVFLDRDSLPTAVPPLPLPHRWQDYPATSPEQLLSHASGAQVLISNKVPLRRAFCPAARARWWRWRPPG